MSCGCNPSQPPQTLIVPAGTVGFPLPVPAGVAIPPTAPSGAAVASPYRVTTAQFPVPVNGSQGSLKAADAGVWARPGLILWFPGIGWLDVVSGGGTTVIVKNSGGMVGGFNLEAGSEFLPMAPFPGSAVGQSFCGGGTSCACDAKPLTDEEVAMLAICGPGGFRSSPLTKAIIETVLSKAFNGATAVDPGTDGVSAMALIDGVLKLTTVRSGMRLITRKTLARQYAGSGIGSEVNGGVAVGSLSGTINLAGDIPSGSSIAWLFLQGGVALNAASTGIVRITVGSELVLFAGMTNINDVDRVEFALPVSVVNNQISYNIELSGPAAYAAITLIGYQV